MPGTILDAVDSLMNKTDNIPRSHEDLTLKKGWVGIIFKIVNL